MSFKSEQVEQITVMLEDRPGVLADLCAYLSDHRINLRAIAVFGNGGSGGGRLVVDDPERARQFLSVAGVKCTSTRCLALEMPNTPGALASVARTLSVAGINIDYIYASVLPDSTKAMGVFGVSDLEQALGLAWEG